MTPTPVMDLPEAVHESLLLCQAKERLENSLRDKWLRVDLSANVETYGCHPYEHGYHAMKRATGTRGHIVLRIPVRLARWLLRVEIWLSRLG